MVLGSILVPNLYSAEQTVEFPPTAEFIRVLTRGAEFLAWITQAIRPSLMVASLILLKIDRMSEATPNA